MEAKREVVEATSDFFKKLKGEEFLTTHEALNKEPEEGNRHERRKQAALMKRAKKEYDKLTLKSILDI